MNCPEQPCLKTLCGICADKVIPTEQKSGHTRKPVPALRLLAKSAAPKIVSRPRLIAALFPHEALRANDK